MKKLIQAKTQIKKQQGLQRSLQRKAQKIKFLTKTRGETPNQRALTHTLESVTLVAKMKQFKVQQMCENQIMKENLPNLIGKSTFRKGISRLENTQQKLKKEIHTNHAIKESIIIQIKLITSFTNY
ncbi:hypothetical protein PPERSA_01118 [Pseudocohnilembus persalinus]|uniref:Uncharacterized protein n=1 Tax=Pseudocohnilembus persalinus TaxID=266149 RepID=A0A0V0QVS7_PSEPJ|nr:hypothetical protein PPERSA_01118 [Pseudocohnilembus persalinus]|eukprot:KRX06040.1 hypothetical protein PPERSA_01118 [Pseudocohnilembus persalinus]